MVFFPQVLCCAGSIGDYVWTDINRNGIQDDGDAGINGVTVILTKPDGSTVSTTTVTGGPASKPGYYQFSGLCAGNYTVAVNSASVPLGGLTPTIDRSANGNDGKTTDSNEPAGTSVTLADNASNQTVDFGYQSPCSGSIGDYVWNDLNRNGIQDAGEEGIGGVTVHLKDNLNNTISTTTDANGKYQFVGLCPGTYVVEVDQNTLPAGYTPTLCNQGSNDAKDSDSDMGNCAPRQTVTLGNNENNVTIDFGFVNECGLAVDKKCYIVPAPTSPFVCSDAKPIDTMVVLWNGSVEPVTVKAWNGSVGTGVAQVFSNVYKGQEVKFTRSGTYPNDVYFQVFDAAGVEIGRSTFHLSCSDVDMNGPEDCGKMAGDGKAVAGYQNWWIFDGMAGKGMVLDCTPTYPDGTDACSFAAPEPPSCATLGAKPKSLVFRYSGGGCAMRDNDQPADKAICTATGSTISGDITVVYAGGNSNLSSDRYVVNPTAVAPNGTFEVSWNGADLKADSYFKVCDASGNCELNKIHTSCSQPLAVNDVFGSLTLAGFNGKYAGAEVKYLYEVKNTGTQSLNIKSVLDDVLGEQLAAPQTLAGGASLKLEDTVLVSGTITNKVTVSTPDPYCKATDALTVTVQPPPPCTVTQAFYAIEDDKYKVRLTNTGSKVVTLDQLVLNWPDAAAYTLIKEVKLDGSIYKADASPLVVTSGVPIGPGNWTNLDVTKRQLNPGETRTLEIIFSKKWPKANCPLGTCFSGAASFAEGCQVDLSQQ